MPPFLATILTYGFIGYLFRRELRQTPTVSRAIWLPVTWMLIIGSRFVSEWLDIWGFHFAGGALEEGSPLDSLVFLFLIIAGVSVVSRRGARLSEIVRNNKLLALFFAYGFIAILVVRFSVCSF